MVQALVARNIATLAGVALEMDQEISWAFTGGTQPFRRSFEIHKDDAAEIMEQAGLPVTLHIEASDGSGDALDVEGIYILETSPGAHPDRVSVWVADRRIWWPGIQIDRAYNVRRSSGEKALIGATLENAVVVDEGKYAAYSLADGAKKYEAADVLADILEDLAPGAASVSGRMPDVEIEDLDAEGPGDAAVALVLGQIPGWSVYVDAAAVVRTYDMAAGGEAGILTGRTIDFPGPGGSADWPINADRRGVRPSVVRVLFDREIEVKWLFDATRGSASSSLGDIETLDNFYVHNVLPSPDPSLSNVKGLPNGKEGGSKTANVGVGTWIPFGNFVDDGESASFGALGAWGEDSANMTDVIAAQSGPAHMRQSTIRRHFSTGFLGIWDFYVKPTGRVNVRWAARIPATAQHWRQTYMPARCWWGLIKSMRATRAGVLSFATGQRARSPVWQDYILRPSEFGTMRSAQKSALTGRLEHGCVVKGYSGQADGSQSESPFSVVMLDRDIGVFSARQGVDPVGEWCAVIPGIPTDDSLPCATPGEANRTPGDVYNTWAELDLHSTHNSATIMTVSPGVPNNETRLQAVNVYPDRAGELIGKDVGPCQGHALDVRISPSLMTARFAWTDDRREAIVSVLRNGGHPPEEALLNHQHLQDVAEAVAASVYVSLLDRPETAGATQNLDPSAAPGGSLGSVTHRLRTDGACVTEFRANKVRVMAAFERWLSPATRKILARSLPEY